MGKNALFWRFPGKSPYLAFFGQNRVFSGIFGVLVPGYRGAPARGVDVKPPSRRGRDLGNPQNGGFGTSGTRGPGSRAPPGVTQRPGEASQSPGGPRRGPGPRSPGLRSGGFTSTPRAGAPRYPGTPGGPGGDPPAYPARGPGLRMPK